MHSPTLERVAPTLDPSSEPPPSSGSGFSGVLPPDLLDEVRGRVRLLTALLSAAFLFDPLVWIGRAAAARWFGLQLTDDLSLTGRFQLVNLGAVAASWGLRRAAGDRRLSAERLHGLGLGYEVLICFVIALMTSWSYYRDQGVMPNMDWTPAVIILFPLVLPGPPRRMLLAGVLAGLTGPLALGLLQLTGQGQATGEDYARRLVSTAFAVGFAYMGARVVYRLGREVARARELGSYRLGELLGKGGMGEVYRATHRMLARPAAIKLIRPDMLGGPNPRLAALAVARFRREAEAAASLRSPHTVELYDFGVTADRTFYFVMELLEGTDLESLVRRTGPLPAERVIHLLRQVCESLEEAHARGLVHRDIKPANLHVGRLGLRHDVVKVLDFGLVKSLAGDPGEAVLATGQGQVAGTPAYMAPEVAAGEAYDGRADLYALGCVAYFLLTGALVFEAATPLAMLARHLRDAPAPPSTRAELPVPPALEQVILACLAKSPERRPADAGALSRALAAVAGPVWGEEEARRWWDTHRLG